MIQLLMNTVSVITELGEHILDRPLRITPLLSSKEFFMITALAVAGHPLGTQ